MSCQGLKSSILMSRLGVSSHSWLNFGTWESAQVNISAIMERDRAEFVKINKMVKGDLPCISLDHYFSGKPLLAAHTSSHTRSSG